MLALLVIAAVVGIILGTIFQVWILVPAVLFAIGVTVLSGFFEHSVVVGMLVALAVGFVLELGYLVGVLVAPQLRNKARELRSRHQDPRA